MSSRRTPSASTILSEIDRIQISAPSASASASASVAASSASRQFMEERQRARDEIKRRQLEELERQKRELEEQQAKIMMEKSEVDEYVERIKYCYKTINRIMEAVKEEKYIIMGHDPIGAVIRGSSKDTIHTDFNLTVSQNIIYYYTHSLATTDVCSRVRIPKIKMAYGNGYSFCQTNGFSTSVGNHGREYNPSTLLSFFTAIKFFTPPSSGQTQYQWDGKTICRVKDSISPSIYSWIQKNAVVSTPKTHRGTGCCSTTQGYQTGYSFRNINFTYQEGQTFCSHQGSQYSGIDASGYSKITPTRQLYLQYLMDEHETMRPHPEFRKTPEHKYVVCQKLMEMLEDMTEKYYIMGKMEISDLEFIEKSIMEMQE